MVSFPQSIDTSAAAGAYRVDISRSQNIGRVSSEWFSRPADDQFLPLDDLYANVRHRAEGARPQLTAGSLDLPALLRYVRQNFILLDIMAKSHGTEPHSAKQARGKARSASTDVIVSVQNVRVEAVMAAAERSGLLKEKGGRIGGRVSAALVRQAKAQTGIQTDTDLIEFALANLALEDKFSEAFKAARGKVDSDLKLGF
ncbi:hypothetical protein [Sphingobium sp. EM0848]|uniref:hypothetical protein n=1 Tax=Sphingobium sp. EM0848 TaxID=2743473 RepID=UPI001C3FB5A2|nr:hypothetical protein [Sphingobium sp. EM0848]